jgi:transposase
MQAFVDLEARVPPDHPLRTIKVLGDQALEALSPEFDRMYAEVGRPSIPPERLLKASLLISLYWVRSERAFCEELDYSLLFRWFLDMNLMEGSFDPTVFTKNRQRLLEHRVGQQFFDEVVAEAHERSLLSDEHFTVDGTLIEAAASLKSFTRRDGDPPPGQTMIRATLRWTSMGNGESTPPIRALRTPRHAYSGRARGRKPSWSSWPTL